MSVLIPLTTTTNNNNNADSNSSYNTNSSDNNNIDDTTTSSSSKIFYDSNIAVSMQVEVLARAHGLLAQAGLMMWGQIEMYATRPFHARTFWKHANTLYRHFTIFFLAHTLQVSPTAVAYTALHILFVTYITLWSSF